MDRNLDRGLLKNIFYIEAGSSRSGKRRAKRTPGKRISVSDTINALSDSEIATVVELVKTVLIGTNISAIKAYRKYTGANLEQAKTVISFLQRVLRVATN